MEEQHAGAGRPGHHGEEPPAGEGTPGWARPPDDGRPEWAAAPPTRAAPGPATGAAVPPPPPDAWRRPVRLEPMVDAPYALAILAPPEATSGPAVGSLVAGIAGIVVALAGSCLGLVGAPEGWGLGVSGAFAVLAGWLGLAGIGLGLVGIRQTARSRDAATVRPTGRGVAVGGLACGAVTALVTVCGVAATALAQFT